MVSCCRLDGGDDVRMGRARPLDLDSRIVDAARHPRRCAGQVLVLERRQPADEKPNRVVGAPRIGSPTRPGRKGSAIPPHR
jgi:hypothetical protein